MKAYKTQEIKKIIKENKEGFVIIDVRDADELSIGKLPGSINIPLDEIQSLYLLEEDEFEKVYGIKKPSKEKELIFYCVSGPRSLTAASILEKQGYSTAYYEGGILSWDQ